MTKSATKSHSGGAEAALARLEQEVRGRTQRTQELWEKAKRFVPDGFSRARFFWPNPLYVDHGEGAHIVDVDHLLCPHGPPNPDFGGVHDVRPDGSHFSDAGALEVARWLMPIVLGEQPAPARIFPRR